MSNPPKWIPREPYKVQLLAQLKSWREGNPVHLGKPTEKMSECCPDFSCCEPNLLAPVEERQKFLLGPNSVRGQMLGMFLVRLLESKGMNVNGKKE